ncbi:MAG TPA: dienelactone hydrolase family protein [Nocardioidaceae bacterium]|nr:dienelactone hydrolase family protein [Nocardioidaceae bacterium]
MIAICVPADAQPPDLPGVDERPKGERTRLTSADGTAFAAHEARATEPSGAAMVVLPDVRGLFGFYASLAESFAGAGVDAIAMDYFGRTAGTDERPGDWEFWPHVQATTPEQVRTDVAATVERVRTISAADRVYTVGFCFGGGHSFAQAASGLGLDGVIGFYGPPRKKRDNFPSPIELVDDFECPVLGLFGGADEGIPADEVDAFGSALSATGVEHRLHTYPGAPHSFFDRSYDAYAEECADAWRRVLAFTGRR